MNTLNENSDEYRAGYLAGYPDRQAEIDAVNDLADRYYRQAYNDERRIRGDVITRAELEQRRRLNEPPAEVTRAAALASWGLTDDTEPSPDEPGQAANPTVDEVSLAKNTNRTGRRRVVSTRTVIGNLATNPEIVQAGRVQIVKLRVVEDTGEWRGGKYVPHPDAITHFVEAKFELGENAAATLHQGDAIIIVGREHTASWGRKAPKTTDASWRPTTSASTSTTPPQTSGKSAVITAVGSGGGAGGSGLFAVVTDHWEDAVMNSRVELDMTSENDARYAVLVNALGEYASTLDQQADDEEARDSGSFAAAGLRHDAATARDLVAEIEQQLQN